MIDLTKRPKVVPGLGILRLEGSSFTRAAPKRLPWDHRRVILYRPVTTNAYLLFEEISSLSAAGLFSLPAQVADFLVAHADQVPENAEWKPKFSGAGAQKIIFLGTSYRCEFYCGFDRWRQATGYRNIVYRSGSFEEALPFEINSRVADVYPYEKFALWNTGEIGAEREPIERIRREFLKRFADEL